MDIILRPVPLGQDICLWPPLEVDDCTPVVPPSSGGSAGGAATWHGPRHKAQKSPWERARSLETNRPIAKRGKNLLVVQAADDLEVVQILTKFLSQNP